ncbi:hypothetical protein K7432_011561 [Basidiobolus ranarum]|uniref:Uncharacterized protein n=1 Tax=Basidiobolus ranarum TaxID=34480 RepID=A0ABR2VUG5_9FUNG
MELTEAEATEEIELTLELTLELIDDTAEESSEEMDCKVDVTSIEVVGCPSGDELIEVGSPPIDVGGTVVVIVIPLASMQIMSGHKVTYAVPY